MKRVSFILAPVFLLALLFPKLVEARSGCCSHHGGVCGCGCCDGTSLSNTCAPYYPECSRPVYVAPVATAKPSTPKPIIATKKPYIPTASPEPTQAPTTSPTAEAEVLGISATEQPLESPIVTQTPTPTIEPLVEGTTTKKSGFVDLALIGLAGWGYMKYRKNKTLQT